jgi:anhydro-N-acetylmuramic acid kinase
MILNKFAGRRNLTVIGMNAGTSADGLDLAAVRIRFLTNSIKVKFIKGKTSQYPANLYRAVDHVVCGDNTSIEDMVRLDRILGDYYGRQAARFCRQLKCQGTNVNLIASHGQTILHLPGKIKIGRCMESSTVQLGHPETIAARTNLPVVADFRQGDIALGGEGAPITSLAMWHLFSSKSTSRLLVNIGGIANYFLFPGGRGPNKAMAADCGPGNSLLDILSRKLYGQRFDRGGRLAAQGTISKRLLTILTADNFLKGKYGPSTGRERFGEKFVTKILKSAKKLGLSNRDILSTTTELTALSIATSIIPYLAKYDLRSIYLFGGGAKNRYMIKLLKAILSGVDVFSVDELGYNPDYLEAVCYAVMGAMAMQGRSSILPHITGAKYKIPAGRIIQPPL